jgi:hypothetical protein
VAVIFFTAQLYFPIVKLRKTMEESAARADIPDETGTWDFTECKSGVLCIAPPHLVVEFRAWSLRTALLII